MSEPNKDDWGIRLYNIMRDLRKGKIITETDGNVYFRHDIDPLRAEISLYDFIASYRESLLAEKDMPENEYVIANRTVAEELDRLLCLINRHNPMVAEGQLFVDVYAGEIANARASLSHWRSESKE